MSCVTNIILTSMVGEDKAVAELNRKLSSVVICSSGSGVELISCTDLSQEHGGNKYLECEIYLAAYNRFKLDVFLKVLQSVSWGFPEDVQLFVKGQHDDKFQEVVVFTDDESQPKAT